MQILSQKTSSPRPTEARSARLPVNPAPTSSAPLPDLAELTTSEPALHVTNEKHGSHSPAVTDSRLAAIAAEIRALGVTAADCPTRDTFESRNAASHCEQIQWPDRKVCGKPLTTELWRLGVNTGRGLFGGTARRIQAICGECKEKHTWTRFYVGRPCEFCGRIVHHEATRHRRLYALCSARCSYAFHTRLQKERRPARQQRTCIVCTKPYQGRKDSTTCSSACRQKQYRQNRLQRPDSEQAAINPEAR